MWEAVDNRAACHNSTQCREFARRIGGPSTGDRSTGCAEPRQCGALFQEEAGPDHREARHR